MAGSIGVCATVAGDGDVGEPRVARELVGGEPHARERRGALRSDEEVGGLEELRHGLAAGLALEIQASDRDALVERAVPLGREAFERIAFGRLDLRHRRAERAQPRAGDRPGHVERGGDNTNPSEHG